VRGVGWLVIAPYGGEDYLPLSQHATSHEPQTGCNQGDNNRVSTHSIPHPNRKSRLTTHHMTHTLTSSSAQKRHIPATFKVTIDNARARRAVSTSAPTHWDPIDMSHACRSFALARLSYRCINAYM